MIDRLKLAELLIGKEALLKLQADGKVLDGIVTTYDERSKSVIEQLFEAAIHKLDTGGKPLDTDVFNVLFQQMFLETAIASYKIAESGVEEKGAPKKKLAKLPERPKLPKSLRTLMEEWDSLKNKPKKRLDKRAKALADRMKKEYLQRVNGFWRKNQDAWRSGDEASKAYARKLLEKEVKATYSRAKTIIETETTNTVNEVRTAYYGASPDITHFLFMSVRDFATTKWCKTRHGVVYKKDAAVTEKERPACHWNCRSEMVPLSPLNPRHLKLIEDKSLWRENRSPAPLPPGWN